MFKNVYIIDVIVTNDYINIYLRGTSMDIRREEQIYAGMEFEEALRYFADTVNRACRLHCGNEEDAKDCFQNTFLKLYLSDKKFDDKEYLKAWLLTVALHECANLHRQSWKTRINLTDDMSSVLLEQEQFKRVIEEHSDGTLEEVLTMPLKYRQVLYLFYYEEYNIAEIAHILMTSENTVKTRLARGRKKLNLRLQQNATSGCSMYIG